MKDKYSTCCLIIFITNKIFCVRAQESKQEVYEFLGMRMRDENAQSKQTQQGDLKNTLLHLSEPVKFSSRVSFAYAPCICPDKIHALSISAAVLLLNMTQSNKISSSSLLD